MNGWCESGDRSIEFSDSMRSPTATSQAAILRVRDSSTDVRSELLEGLLIPPGCAEGPTTRVQVLESNPTRRRGDRECPNRRRARWDFASRRSSVPGPMPRARRRTRRTETPHVRSRSGRCDGPKRPRTRRQAARCSAGRSTPRRCHSPRSPRVTHGPSCHRPAPSPSEPSRTVAAFPSGTT